MFIGFRMKSLLRHLAFARIHLRNKYTTNCESRPYMKGTDNDCELVTDVRGCAGTDELKLGEV